MNQTTPKPPIYDWTGATWHRVPTHLRGGLMAYVEHGRPTGGGLRALLENRPIFEVLPLLDDTVLPAALDVLKFFYSSIPSQAWGSEDKVKRWIKMGGCTGGAQS